jgi:hypothetical protein
LADDTRCTTCPRRLKNTAIGNHAGPVGSITTSNRVPSGQPANAAVSISLRLSVVGHAFRLVIVLASPSSTRTVCALAIPKSIPTRRLSLIISVSFGWLSVFSPARPKERHHQGHGPKEALR